MCKKKRTVTPTLDTLTYTTSLEDGTLTISNVTPTKDSSNVYKYKISDTKQTITYDQNVQTWTAWDGTSTIEGVTANKYIALVEATSDYKARKSGSVQITA